MTIPFNMSFASNDRSKQWHKDNSKKAEDVLKSCTTKYGFNCDKCNHKYYMSPKTITTKNSICPFCNNKELCESPDCDVCFQKSFASEKNSKYLNDNPRKLFKNSKGKKEFKCDVCNHSIYIRICDMSNNDWCYICSGKDICTDDKCNMCFENSFASVEQSKYWENTCNPWYPRRMIKTSKVERLFKCDVCNHNSVIRICDMTKDNWCKKCKGEKICEFLECKLCYNNSFESHPLAKNWLNDNGARPRYFTKLSNEKKMFGCTECHHVSVHKICDMSKENWCPYCSEKKYCVNNCEWCFSNESILYEPGFCDKHLKM